MDGGPYPSSSSGPIHTIANTTTWVKGRHTFKAGLQLEYSGEDDFDQINVSAIPGSTNNQNGRFEFLDNARWRHRHGDRRTWRWACSTTTPSSASATSPKWRALATDVFVQDSWKPTSALTVEGGFRYVYWPPWYSTTNNISNFDPRFYDPAQAAIINPHDGPSRSAARATTASCCRATASKATSAPRWRTTRRSSRCSAASRAASPRRTRTCSNRASA